MERHETSKKMEEHITMVKELNSRFIGYATPAEGTGVGIMSAMTDFLPANELSLDHLVDISCDGTYVNTGKYNGTVSLLEQHLKQPLQWFVCLFHFNDLPFTALLKKLVGNSTGPKTWAGEMGQMLQSCEDIPAVQNFDKIEMGEMPPNINNWDLRADQKYLFDMVRAVNSGYCDDSLASIKPGPLNVSRWLTTASRILRLYVTKEVPSVTLKKLAYFVMKVYAPFWFLVKNQPQAFHGSYHLIKYIQWTRELSQEEQSIVQHSIKLNAYFAHPDQNDQIIEIPEFPCHSQSTERFVRVVSQSCLSVIHKNRLELIASKIDSRRMYSRLESRQDFI